MARANIRTFTTDTGGKPVEDWIRSLTPQERAEVILVVELLEAHGHDLGMPHARYVESGLWELRVRVGRVRLRIFYFHWKGRTFGLLHGLAKKTAATPRAEIERAQARRAAWLARDRAGRSEAKGGEEEHE